jgi:SAM-dependent methyltransferase
VPPRLSIPADGFYARKQIFSESRLISFSHRQRFLTGLDLVTPLADGKRVLDFGCGDGSFLHALLGSDCKPSEMIGAEVSRDLVERLRGSFPVTPNLRFLHTCDLPLLAAQTPIDLIVCMEVLEHVIDPERVLGTLHGLLADGGRIVISVPVETGPVLLVKQAARILAGWRRIGDYQWTSRYTLAEYWSSFFAGPEQHIVRPVYHDSGMPHHCHKGFNWRYLQSKIAARFNLQRVLGSPFPKLPPFLASQVWFVAEK